MLNFPCAKCCEKFETLDNSMNLCYNTNNKVHLHAVI